LAGGKLRKENKKKSQIRKREGKSSLKKLKAFRHYIANGCRRREGTPGTRGKRSKKLIDTALDLAEQEAGDK